MISLRSKTFVGAGISHRGLGAPVRVPMAERGMEEDLWEEPFSLS